MRKVSPHLKAILYALVGYSCWVAADSFVKLAIAIDVPKYQVIGIAAPAGMLILFLLTALRGRVKKLRPKHTQGLSALGLLLILTYIAGVLGLKYLPLMNYYSIVYAGPIVVGFLAAHFFREKMDKRKIIATVSGFGGVLIAIGIFSLGESGNWIGYGFAFMNMLVGVAQQLIMRFLGNRESRECTAFWPRLAPTIACFLAGCVWGFEPMTTQAVFYSFMVGAVGSVGWLCLAEAYRYGEAATVAPYQYTQIVSGGILGYVIWGDVPTAHLLIGAVIIAVSGIYIAVHTHRSRAAPAIAEL